MCIMHLTIHNTNTRDVVVAVVAIGKSMPNWLKLDRSQQLNHNNRYTIFLRQRQKYIDELHIFITGMASLEIE